MLQRLIAQLSAALQPPVNRGVLQTCVTNITRFLLFSDTTHLDQDMVRTATRLVGSANALLEGRVPPPVAPRREVRQAPPVIDRSSPKLLATVASRQEDRKADEKWEKAADEKKGPVRVAQSAIPKIIHCTWAGGGPIATTKSLDGIKSWLEKTKNRSNYEVWVWWDDAHVYNMHVRKILSKYPQARANYDRSAESNPSEVRRTVLPGRDLHNLRFLTQGMPAELKLQFTRALIQESFDDLEPLRQLASENPARLKLCNIRSHEFLTGMHFLNMRAYDQELTTRGMFAAAASDILRYEVLYNFGGVYMDVDIELTSDLGDLAVEANGALVGITPDRKGKELKQTWPGRELIATTPQYNGKCLYLSNCIVAACPQSPLIDALRQTIRLGYELIGWRSPKMAFEIDHNRQLDAYWKNNITRSTLDLTGPNLVRDCLWMYTEGVPWRQMPERCLARLSQALTAHPGVVSNTLKEDTNLPSSRIDYVWRDDVSQHIPFWQWVAHRATFPMRHVQCDTDAAERSDCRAASRQRPPDDEKAFYFAHFPGIPRDGVVKGLLDELHKQYGVKNALPAGLKLNDELEWGFARWKVTEISEPTAKKRFITLKRL